MAKKKAEGVAVVPPVAASAVVAAPAAAVAKAPGVKAVKKAAGAKKMVKKTPGGQAGPPRPAAAPSLPKAEALYDYGAQVCWGRVEPFFCSVTTNL
jgi:hypothetical protein